MGEECIKIHVVSPAQTKHFITWDVCMCVCDIFVVCDRGVTTTCSTSLLYNIAACQRFWNELSSALPCHLELTLVIGVTPCFWTDYPILGWDEKVLFVKCGFICPTCVSHVHQCKCICSAIVLFKYFNCTLILVSNTICLLSTFRCRWKDWWSPMREKSGVL